MAIIIETTNAAKLLKEIYEKIDDQTIRTWARMGRSAKLTHVTSSAQYAELAWFTPKRITDEATLIFAINFPEDTEPDRARGLYAIYHGRFTEMLLSHAHYGFSLSYTTAKPKPYDEMPVRIRAVLNK